MMARRGHLCKRNLRHQSGPQNLSDFRGFVISCFFINRYPPQYSFAHRIGGIFSKRLAACVFDIGGAIIIAAIRYAAVEQS
jgi:hypothetical protein